MPIERARSPARASVAFAPQAHRLPHQARARPLRSGACRRARGEVRADAHRRRRALGDGSRSRRPARSIAAPRARQTPGPRAANCWRGDWHRERRCRRLRPPRRARARGPSPQVGLDAAHDVMRRGPDRNPIGREIESAAGTRRRSSEIATRIHSGSRCAIDRYTGAAGAALLPRRSRATTRSRDASSPAGS